MASELALEVEFGIGVGAGVGAGAGGFGEPLSFELTLEAASISSNEAKVSELTMTWGAI